ncbi:hypothetical protein ACFQ71_37515 [Streptomyces sp. NPDC056534]|uniref:hypothetical protein n=1 Tax=Streptomyces sp. NPDC056534 TaxID=3345857 RepID=UPI0036C1F120
MGDPAARGARHAAGLSELTDPRRYLHVPRNFSDDDAEIRIDTPEHLRFNEDLVADLIKKKLALENVSFTWQRAGRNTHVVVKKRKAPPKKLGLSDPGVREILAKMPESAPLIGFGAGKKKVSVDLDADSPHVLISAGIGGGKSTILHTICCQFIPQRRARLRPGLQADLPQLGAQRPRRHLLPGHRRDPRRPDRARPGRPAPPVLDADDVGASMTFATVMITRPVPPRETAPDGPWAIAGSRRPAEPAGRVAAGEPRF